MKKKSTLLIILIVGLAFMNCNTPGISTLSPDSKVSHMPSFTLTVTGSDFDSGTIIVFNNVEKVTTFISNSEITCQIDPDDIANGPATLPVVAKNSGTFGGESDPLDFQVLANHTFTNPVLIATHEISYLPVLGPVIVLDSDQNINIGWGENAGAPGCEGSCYFIRSEDLGSTWIYKQTVSPQAFYGNFYPHLCVEDSGEINYVYTKQINSIGAYDMYFKRSINGGTSWSNPIQLTDNWWSKSNDICMNPSGHILIASSIYLSTDPASEIRIMGSDDGGISWFGPVNISQTPPNWSLSSQMAVDDTGNISVVWAENTAIPDIEIGFSRSTNGGTTWTSPVYISDLTDISGPRVSVDEAGNIYVIWKEMINSDYKLRFTRSTDGGNAWSVPETISDPLSYYNNYDIVADTAGNINVIYFNSSIRFKRSTDRGLSWQPEVLIPVTGTPSALGIEVDQYGNIYIAIANTDLYFCRSQH